VRARPGLLVLAAGLVMLGVGVGFAVGRQNRAVDAREARAAANRQRYDAVLRRAVNRPPRFTVSYVEMPLAALRRLTRQGYALVPNEVARRLDTGRPSLHPDFTAMAAGRTDPSALAFRAHAARDETLHVVALLVEQTTPGDVARLRLDVDRLALTAYAEVWGASDLLATKFNQISIFRRGTLGPKTKRVVAWRPRLDGTAIVPLAVLHVFRVPNTPENSTVTGALGGYVVQVTTGTVLAARRLAIKRTNGNDVDVPLQYALHPLVLTVGPSS
jgi:hypothetical protein